MEGKFMDYIVKCVRSTDACRNGVNVAMDLLIKQAKINRKQKVFNVIFALCGLAMFSQISDMQKVINKQSKQIKELQANEQKGE